MQQFLSFINKDLYVELKDVDTEQLLFSGTTGDDGSAVIQNNEAPNFPMGSRLRSVQGNLGFAAVTFT